MIISAKGYDQLKYSGAYPVDKDIFYPKFIERDNSARDSYRTEIKRSKSYLDDIFVLDIIREEMVNDDPRIQRIIFK